MAIYFKVVEGSTNYYSVFVRDLSPNINARYLRISPQYWNKYPCLRADFLGCSSNEGIGKSFHFISLIILPYYRKLTFHEIIVN